MRTLPRISASHAHYNFKEVYSERDKYTERHYQEPGLAFTISSQKDLKNSQQLYNLQNTGGATTSDEDSVLKGLTPVSRKINTFKLNTQRQHEEIINVMKVGDVVGKCPSGTASDHTRKTTIRSMKSMSNRSKRSNTKSL